MRAILFPCLLLPALALAEPVAPHPSWRHAPLSNGHGAGVYDTMAGKLVDFWTHPYAEAKAGKFTPDLMWDAFFGVHVGSTGLWLPAVTPITASYENGTGILVVVRETLGMRFTERWFAPMDATAPVLVGTLAARNMTGEPVAGVRLFSLHNFHVGPGQPEAGFQSETVLWNGAESRFLEKGASGRIAAVAALEQPSHHAASPLEPYQAMPKDGTIGDCDGGQTQDDAISAFEWDFPDPLAPGEDRTVGIAMAVTDSLDAPGLAAALAQVTSKGGPDVLVDAERAWWKAFHAVDKLPPALAGDGLALARQSLALLAMAQVREADSDGRRPHGQILASLPPGQWNRTWVRDQGYAAVALAATGHAAEARAAVDFVLGAQAGAFEKEVGSKYLVSVCRYFGWGIEESDGAGTAIGPNVEFDGFGLFLWMLHEVASRMGGGKVEPDVWYKVKTGVADVLLSLVGPDGLIRPDSGIWEVHWNGNEKRFTNTSASAVLGLCAAADMAVAMGDAASGSYRDGARKVAAAMNGALILPSGALAGNMEEIGGGKCMDAAAVEAFNWDVLDPGGDVANATLDAYKSALFMKKTGHGYMRNDDGGQYDRQEWVFVDLRIAHALRRAGRNQQAADLAGWVVAQTRENMDLIAELYSEDKADYAGAVPMGGFGAGAYLLWVSGHVPSVDVKKCLAEEPVIEPGIDAGENGNGPDPAHGEDAVETNDSVEPDIPDIPSPAPAGRGGCSAGGGVRFLHAILWLLMFAFRKGSSAPTAR